MKTRTGVVAAGRSTRATTYLHRRAASRPWMSERTVKVRANQRRSGRKPLSQCRFGSSGPSFRIRLLWAAT